MLNLLRCTIASVFILSLAACAAMPTATPVPTPSDTLATALTASPRITLAPTPTATSESTSAPTVPTGNQEFLPSQRSVWDTQISPGETRGKCTGEVILPVYGLVQITPTEDGLEWKNQEPQPYAMTRIAPNTYHFAGKSAISNGIVTMTVTFLNDKSLVMLREFTPNDDPQCVHRHRYAGEFKWFR